MKRFVAVGLAFITCLMTLSEAKGGGGGKTSGGKVSVSGYTRKDGTYVAPYVRNAPGGGTSSSNSTGTGIRCGNSYISAADTCHIGSTVVTDTTFANCTEARAAGFHDILTDEPGYSEKLDRDHDGIACESGGSDDGPGDLSTGGTSSGPVKLSFSSTDPYDAMNDFATLPIKCAVTTFYKFHALTPFNGMSFNLDGWPSGDVLIIVSIDGTPQYMTSRMGEEEIEAGSQYPNSEVSISVMPLDGNTACPEHIWLRKLVLSLS